MPRNIDYEMHELYDGDHPLCSFNDPAAARQEALAEAKRCGRPIKIYRKRVRETFDWVRTISPKMDE